MGAAAGAAGCVRQARLVRVDGKQQRADVRVDLVAREANLHSSTGRGAGASAVANGLGVTLPIVRWGKVGMMAGEAQPRQGVPGQPSLWRRRLRRRCANGSTHPPCVEGGAPWCSASRILRRVKAAASRQQRPTAGPFQTAPTSAPPPRALGAQVVAEEANQEWPRRSTPGWLSVAFPLARAALRSQRQVQRSPLVLLQPNFSNLSSL